MDKFIPAGIYSHMGDLSTAAGIKEHQITLCQFSTTDPDACLVLFT